MKCKRKNVTLNSKKLDRLVEISKALKTERQNGRSFHVSFIYHGSKMLSLGVNSYTDGYPIKKIGRYLPHKQVGNYEAGLHSEVAAAKNLNFDCYDMTIINIRIDNNGNLAYSAPCINCWNKIILGCGIKKVIFSTSDSFKELKI